MLSKKSGKVKELTVDCGGNQKKWGELYTEISADPETKYVLDMHGRGISVTLNNRNMLQVWALPNVQLIVHTPNDLRVVQALFLTNMMSIKNKVYLAQESMEVVDVARINVVDKERIERIKQSFFEIEGDTCYIVYPDIMEVDEDMVQIINDAIISASLEQEYAEVKKFIIEINIAQMNKGARIGLYRMLFAAKNSDKYNNKDIILDLTKISNTAIRTDLGELLQIKNFDAPKEERDMLFSHTLAVGTAGRFVKYCARTEGSGNKDNVVHRDESEVLLSRVAVYQGMKETANGKKAVFLSLNASRKDLMSLTEEEIYAKYNDKNIKRPDIVIYTNEFDVMEIGYDDEFLGETYEFKRFNPLSREETIIDGQRVMVSDAYYAKGLLDSYNVPYNEAELEEDILRAEKANAELPQSSSESSSDSKFVSEWATVEPASTENTNKAVIPTESLEAEAGVKGEQDTVTGTEQSTTVSQTTETQDTKPVFNILSPQSSQDEQPQEGGIDSADLSSLLNNFMDFRSA